MSNTQALAEQTDTGTAVLTISDKPNFAILGIVPRSVDEMFALAERVAASGLVPKTYIDNPGAVLVAWQMGAELGLAPMQAVQCICVINGMPTVWGTGRRALVKAHPAFEWQTEEWDADTQTAYCTMKRRGEPAQAKSFSMADAKLAGLDKKDTYKGYPREMCANRAHARATDSVFPDAVKGLRNAEDVIDLPPDQWEGKEAPKAVRMPQARTTDATVADNGKAPAPSAEQTAGEKITEQQHKLLRANLGKAAGADADLLTALTDGLKTFMNVEHLTDVPKANVNSALSWIAEKAK